MQQLAGAGPFSRLFVLVLVFVFVLFFVDVPCTHGLSCLLASDTTQPKLVRQSVLSEAPGYAAPSSYTCKDPFYSAPKNVRRYVGSTAKLSPSTHIHTRTHT